MMLLWCLGLTAWAGVFEDVRRPLGPDAWVNWTRRQVEVVVSAEDPSLAGDTKPLEQRAIQAIDGQIASLVGRVQVDPLATVARLEGQGLGEVRVRRLWHVGETRYFASGRVEVVGVVDLHELLTGWNKARSKPEPADLGGAPTGWLIDARGLGVQPAYAPQLQGPDGEVLFSGEVWSHLAYDMAPVVWVSDPAAPQAVVAGDAPELFVAVGGGVGVIRLDAAASDRLRTGMSAASARGRGAVVLVVDP